MRRALACVVLLAVWCVSSLPAQGRLERVRHELEDDPKPSKPAATPPWLLSRSSNSATSPLNDVRKFWNCDSCVKES